MPGSWRPKHDQAHGPTDYNIVRLLTIGEDKEKGRKIFRNVPGFERPKYGMISKVQILIIQYSRIQVSRWQKSRSQKLIQDRTSKS